MSEHCCPLLLKAFGEDCLQSMDLSGLVHVAWSLHQQHEVHEGIVANSDGNMGEGLFAWVGYVERVVKGRVRFLLVWHCFLELE
jgi:hypothetical protein